MSKLPLTELPSLEDYDTQDILSMNAAPLLWGVHLPPSVDAERLQFNVGALERVQRVGAVATCLVTEYQGDRSEFTLGVTGINADGTGIASSVGTCRPAEKSKVSHIDDPAIPDNRIIRSSFGKAILQQSLNKAELASKVSDEIRSGKSREDAWARQLNSAFAISFRAGSKEHLMGHCSKLLLPLDYLFYAGYGYAIASAVAAGHTTSLPLLYAGAQAVVTGRDALYNIKATGDTLLSEKRWSLFMRDHQSDRYAALSAMSRLATFVSVKK